jgi:hypothetical protein
MRQPHLHLDINPQELANPKWTIENGQEFTSGGVIIVEKVDGLPPKLGEKRFTREDGPALMEYLAIKYQPYLFEEYLSNSQSSFYDNNLRRAILELAIACEINVKRFIFGSNSIASGVFEYYEDKTRSLGRVIDLIGPAAKRAFGTSFKETNENDYRNIDNLYRCRNKIAHRGELSFRDDAGNTHLVENDDFVKWWTSVEQLRNWLESFRGKY